MHTNFREPLWHKLAWAAMGVFGRRFRLWLLNNVVDRGGT